MTEAMIVEAVRAAQANAAADPAMMGGVSPGAPSAVADPAAVERFQAAMGVNGVSAPEAVDPIPFASEASAAWRSAQVNHQGILHRIRALAQLDRMHGPSAAEMVELQYDLQMWNLALTTMTNINKNMGDALNSIASNFR